MQGRTCCGIRFARLLHACAGHNAQRRGRSGPVGALLPAPAFPPPGTMPQLRVEFLAGFHDDDVVLCLDGREVHRQAELTTDYSIGLAGAVELDVPAGAHMIQLELPTRNLHASVDVTLTAPLYVHFELDPHGRIRSHIASDPQPRF